MASSSFCAYPQLSLSGCAPSSAWFEAVTIVSSVGLLLYAWSALACVATAIERWTRRGFTATTLPDVMAFVLTAIGVTQIIRFIFLLSSDISSAALIRIFLFISRLPHVLAISAYLAVAGLLATLFSQQLARRKSSRLAAIFFFSPLTPLLGLSIIEAILSSQPANDSHNNYSDIHLIVGAVFGVGYATASIFVYVAVRRFRAYVEIQTKNFNNSSKDSLRLLSKKLYVSYLMIVLGPFVAGALILRETYFHTINQSSNPVYHILLSIFEILIPASLICQHGRIFEASHYTNQDYYFLHPTHVVTLNPDFQTSERQARAQPISSTHHSNPNSKLHSVPSPKIQQSRLSNNNNQHNNETLNQMNNINNDTSIFALNMCQPDDNHPLPDPTLLVQVSLSKQIVRWWSDPNYKKQGWRYLFTFPNPINDADARTTSYVCCTVIVTALCLDRFVSSEVALVMLSYASYAFAARALSGPRFEPLAYLVLLFLSPMMVRLGLLEDAFHPGPPNRFSQTIGFSMSSFALLCRFVIFPGIPAIGYWIYGILLTVMFLQASMGQCAGCAIFVVCMKLGLIPQEVCKKCQVKFVVHQEEETVTSRKLRAQSSHSRIPVTDSVSERP